MHGCSFRQCPSHIVTLINTNYSNLANDSSYRRQWKWKCSWFNISQISLLSAVMSFFIGDVEEAYFTDAVSMKDFDRPFAAMLWQGNLILEFAELEGRVS